MDHEQQDRLFRKGLVLVRNGALSDAALVFRRLVDSGSDEPLHLSYCGLLTTVVSGDRQHGLTLCERALRFGADEPQVVINVARVYERTGQRIKAVKVLRRGLRQSSAHPEMLKLINALSPRRQPPLSFVDRSNPLNKTLGVAIAKLTGSYGTADGQQPQLRTRRAATSR